MAVKELSSPDRCEHPNLMVTQLLEIVRCEDCSHVIPIAELFEAYVEYQRMVKTGIAVLQGELDQHRAELERASAELLVTIPRMDSEDQRDTDIRAMMRAHSIMRREREKARDELHEMRSKLNELAHNVLLVHEIEDEREFIGEDISRVRRTVVRADPRGLVRKARAVLQDLKR